MHNSYNLHNLCNCTLHPMHFYFIRIHNTLWTLLREETGTLTILHLIDIAKCNTFQETITLWFGTNVFLLFLYFYKRLCTKAVLGIGKRESFCDTDISKVLGVLDFKNPTLWCSSTSLQDAIKQGTVKPNTPAEKQLEFKKLIRSFRSSEKRSHYDLCLEVISYSTYKFPKKYLKNIREICGDNSTKFKLVKVFWEQS